MSTGIKQLQEAESEALEMIRRAKRDKAQMLQVAKEKARADLEEFRKEMEASLAELGAEDTAADHKFESFLVGSIAIFRQNGRQTNEEV